MWKMYFMYQLKQLKNHVYLQKLSSPRESEVNVCNNARKTFIIVIYGTRFNCIS
jgi:hypothetical protein